MGVSQSVSGKHWRSRLEDERLALALSQRFDLPEIVGRILAARGVGIDDAEQYLNPTLRALLPDPSSFADMGNAVDRIVRAINEGEQIAIFGDYDVDGATSAALLARFFRAIGREVMLYIPDRIREGYGPNAPALLALKEKGASLVLTVDCGITAFEPLRDADSAGLDVIVIDHHVAEPQLPVAAAVVNPNRLDDHSGQGQLAAVGVTFMLIIAVNRALREAFWYGEGHQEPNLLNLLDLVALGTVCDVVPLTGINRALVRQGLKVMGGRQNIGLAALSDVAAQTGPPSAYHAGFLLGPRVNAGGRVGESGLGVQLLSTEDQAEAAAIAGKLDTFNVERKSIEADVQEMAMEMATEQVRDGCEIILVADQNWHPGVIGIVAGRLKDRFNRPACVVSLSDGVGKGSGRSVAGFALGPAIIAAHQSGLLINGGGHAMAAGFTVKAAGLPELGEFLNARCRDEVGKGGVVATLGLDAAISVEGATLDLVHEIEALGPFGAGNPRPRFAIPDARIVKADIVGQDHISCMVTGPEQGKRLKAIAFRCADRPLGNALLNARGVSLNLAGHIQIDEWQGRQNVQLVIEDAAWPGGDG